MASLQFQHDVEIKKANPLRRYRRKQKLQNAYRLVSICIALFVFYGTSLLPIGVKIFGLLSSERVGLFKNSFFAFVLGNAIVLFIYLLSDSNDGKTGGRQEVCDECVNGSECPLKTTAGHESLPSSMNKTEELSPVKETMTADYSDKKIIWPEVKESPVSEEILTAITETTKTTATTTPFCRKVSRIANSKKVKCYRRVKSESYERRIVPEPRRELKRVNTEVSREMLKCGGGLEKRLCSVEKLSNEEFNRTVDDFIAKQKRKQWEEHRELKKLDYLALKI